MFTKLGDSVTRNWQVVLTFWAGLTLVLGLVAPSWDQITNDGDFAYLPADVSSVQAEKILEEAFPRDRAKSQVAVVLFRKDGPLDESDLGHVAYDMARRLHNLYAVAAITRAQRLEQELQQLQALSAPPADTTKSESSVNEPSRPIEITEPVDSIPPNEPSKPSEPAESSAEPDSPEPNGATDPIAKLRERADDWWERAEGALDEAIHLDSLLEYPRPALGAGSRWAVPIANRAILYSLRGRADEARQDREILAELAPDYPIDETLRPEMAARQPLLDLWTWRDPLFGAKLRSEDGRARVMLLQLSEEFLAVGNVELARFLREQVAEVRQAAKEAKLDHLEIGLSGSASVGGDLLIASESSIRNTEAFTIILVIAILAIVYRSPLLVFVPLVTIFVSLRVATALVAVLTQADALPGMSWWSLKVFTTSKIFIVVILFGAGTDFCLFLIARCRESLGLGSRGGEAVAQSVAGVGDALTASALTTVLGLAMMVFAEFGKFRYSGPVIGLCLLVTLAASLTLTPALLCMLVRHLRPAPVESESPFWRRLSVLVTERPRRVLLGTAVLLIPLAWFGASHANHVTYDFLSSLDPDSPSRHGAELMQQSFPIGESGPVTIVAELPRASLESKTGRDEVARLNFHLHGLPGIASVRSLADPLGETEPGDEAILLSEETLEARFARYHHRTSELFLAQSPEWQGRVTRLEVVFDEDPFSLEARQSLTRLEQQLHDFSEQNEFWRGASFYFTGTTAGIRDLAAVTQSDTWRIEKLVVLAVFLVLVVILKRPVVCVYLVLSVLLSYFVTVGAMDLCFAWIDPDYQGLDWKVPLFLFVILVAVGQDYNVYLVTRVVEEHRRHGSLRGLRIAVERTGGIITSCGVIMAGTFLSMTGTMWTAMLKDWTGLSWLPDPNYLKGIVQLGAALAFGVMLDTLVVRSILVPAFLAWRGAGDSEVGDERAQAR
ncbi:MAG: MMPL family transporter [Planctomycetales bacterium]|nr:MMPL family transporter [Planctomycetales bacterium]